MIVTQAEIRGFRNLSGLTLLPCPSLNVLVGDNGAGKSSVLEALQCLSVGHSFRTRKIRELIQHSEDCFTLTGHIQDPSSGREHRCGLQRCRDGDTRLRLDYEEVHSMAAMTRLLPIKSITPDSHSLIQEGPDERRRFLDWGVFHMEPAFLDAWKTFRRSLSQRNQTLRDQRPDPEVESWNGALADAGTRIHTLRASYVEQLSSALELMLTSMDIRFAVSLRYRAGWVSDKTLAEALLDNLAHSRRMRTTTDGPHRAELVVETDGTPSKQVLSRGQQKVLVYALHLCQLQLLQTQLGRNAIVLCDDPASELDQGHLDRVLQTLARLGNQTFLTGTELSVPQQLSCARFHVEHGSLKTSV